MIQGSRECDVARIPRSPIATTASEQLATAFNTRPDGRGLAQDQEFWPKLSRKGKCEATNRARSLCSLFLTTTNDINQEKNSKRKIIGMRPTNCILGDNDLMSLYVTGFDGRLWPAGTHWRGIE